MFARISDRIVQLHKEVYGKGPTKARTCWQGEVITVVLRGGLTRAEETLLEAGREEAVARQRMQFQEAVRGRFVGAIEELTGRAVIGYMSGVQAAEPEMSVDVFVLEPDPSHPGDRRDEDASADGDAAE